MAIVGIIGIIKNYKIYGNYGNYKININYHKLIIYKYNKNAEGKSIIFIIY